MIPVAPRIGNQVSYVTTIKHASHFVWQGAVLGEPQVSLFVAGAALGEGQVYLFAVGAVFGEGLNVRLGAKRLYFTIENARGELEK